MDRIIAAIFLGILFLMGLLSLLRIRRKYFERIKFTSGFLTKFVDYLNSRGQDIASYNWLIKESAIMQSYMGGLGRMDYQPPFANYMHRNTPVIINFIPLIQREFEGGNDLLTASEYANSTRECLLRYLGVMEKNWKDKTKDIKNPFVWLREGVDVVFSIPLFVLNSLGLIGDSRVESIGDNPLFKFFTGIGALISFISSIITILAGWDTVINLANKWLIP